MTNPTNPFNWQMPTASDLVTDLPADFEVFGQAVATSMADLLGGTTGQVLSKTSNTDMDFTWVAQDDSNAIQNAIVDAKGDLITATAADTPARLAVGTNGQTLVADSTASTGLKWATPASGSTFVGARLSRTTSLSVPTATYTAVNWDSEVFDTDAFHSTSTNTSRITIPSGKDGKYLFICRIMFPTGSAGGQDVSLYKNGVEYSYNTMPPNSATNTTVHMETIVEAVATDYFETFVFQNSGISRTVITQFVATSEFSCEYLGA
jgi:hypothetical protein